MTRPGTRRSDHLQTDRPAGPAAGAGSSVDLDDPDASLSQRPGLAWYWRLPIFLWITSFVFLLLYEILSAVFRMF